MYYAELLRARRALIWYGGILFACVALGLALAFKDGPPRVHMSHDANPMIPLGSLLVGAAFGPIILAGFMAIGLDAELKTAAITWTRPVARLRTALTYVAVDVATLLVAWLFTVVVALIGITVLGISQYLNASDTGSLGVWAPLAFGIAMMWYGLVLLCTTLVPGRGNAVVGVSWAYALFVPGLASIPFPPLLHAAMVALNYVNPLAYLSTTGPSRGEARIQIGGGPLFGGSASTHAIVAWAIAIAAVAIGTRIWTVREVPA
jgi:hypothetical protein